ncbi:MAG: crossover junction endodeoxyribonuclease RuvC [Candidatus Omnitrophica bacterium]|nr:crossover junction endodeoxyribonuclease RuvC [Candidatus Omnitrophota bacterium]
MRILGVDPGLKTTGYGVIEVGEVSSQPVRLLETGTIEPNQKGSLPEKIATIYKNLDAIILEHSPEVMILEKLYAHYKHPTTACILGHARGVICLVCAHRKIKLIEQSVKRIRKALVGNGSASKEQTKAVVAHILKFNPEKISLDASDALALALGHAHLERY